MLLLLLVTGNKSNKLPVNSIEECHGGHSMKAALYARTGSMEHETQDQLLQCRQYALSKGWEVIGIYEDKGISAHELDRLGMKQMISDAELHKFDLIVISSYDRLFRSQSFIEELLNKLYSYDVVVVVAPSIVT
jgi:DNA invertase Pin-like site-specific DNA recombinase